MLSTCQARTFRREYEKGTACKADRSKGSESSLVRVIEQDNKEPRGTRPAAPSGTRTDWEKEDEIKLLEARLEVEVPFTEEQQERLSSALPKTADPDHIAALVARAGAMELLSQAAGAAVFSSISDLRTYRIYCMLEAGMTLHEAEATVAAIFGVESRKAKNMVNATVARYRVELRGKVTQAIRDLLDEAEWDKEGNWVMRLPSMFVRERVSDELESLDVPNPTSAQRGTLWKMSNETYQSLRKAFDLEENPAPDEGA